MKYGELNLGQIEALVNKLGGMDGVKRFLSGESVVKMVERTFSVWMTLTIGGVSSEDLLKKMKKNGFFVSDWAKDIMGKSAFTTLATPHEVSLVRVKVKDLGFTSAPTTNELFFRAKEQGLDLCPAEVGPHLRLALKDQPRGDYFWVAMEPISDSGDGPDVFRVERGGIGEPWLCAGCARPGGRWNLEGGFVFCLRK